MKKPPKQLSLGGYFFVLTYFGPRTARRQTRFPDSAIFTESNKLSVQNSDLNDFSFHKCRLQLSHKYQQLRHTQYPYG